MTLGYTLNQNIAKKIKMRGFRFYAQGTNLWLGTKFRGLPEVGQANLEDQNYAPGQSTLYDYHQIRALTFGVDITF